MRGEQLQKSVPDEPKKPLSRLTRHIGRAGVLASAVLGIHGSNPENSIHENIPILQIQQQQESKEDRAKSDSAYWKKRALQEIDEFAIHGIFDLTRDMTGPHPIVDAYLDLYDSWKNKPFAEQLLRNVASYGSEAIVKRMAVFKKAPYAKKILEEQIGYYGFLENAHQLIGEPYAEELIRKAAQSYPQTFLNNLSLYSKAPFFNQLLNECITKNIQGDYPGMLVETYGAWSNYYPNADNVLHTAALRAIHLDPGSNIASYQSLRQFPDAQDILRRSVAQLTETESTEALKLFPEYQFLEHSDEMVKHAVRRIIPTEPSVALAKGEYYRNLKGGKELFEKVVRATLRFDAGDVIDPFPLYQDEAYAEEIIRAAAFADPREFLRRCFALELHKKPYGRELVETSALQTPIYAAGEKEVIAFLKKSTNERVRHLAKLLADYEGGPFIVIPDSTGDRLYPVKNSTPKEAFQSFAAMVRVRADPRHIGDADLNELMKYYALESVRQLNDLHGERDELRFAGVRNFTSSQLYTFMIYGDQELYTSSFNGLFLRMIESMKKEGINGTQLLAMTGKNKFRTFIRLCASYNRLDDFLATMDADSQRVLLSDFVKGIDKEEGMLQQAVTIADVFSIVTDKKIVRVFQEVIRSEYERVQSKSNSDAAVLYGLLAGMFGERAVINESWLGYMAEKYRLSDVNTLDARTLFDKKGANIQRYFFYGDEDGVSSFENLLFTYKKDTSWEIDDKGTYLIISKRIDGKGVMIYANKPTQEEEGNKAIDEAIKKQAQTVSVYVHRGHSFHADATIKKISSNAALVSLGSCGGYQNAEKVLARSSKAHIISTKGEGTMNVNDPVFKALNDEIVKGKNIVWQQFWTHMEQRLESVSAFHNYVPPHRNLGVLFLKAYYRMEGVESSPPLPDTAE